MNGNGIVRRRNITAKTTEELPFFTHSPDIKKQHLLNARKYIHVHRKTTALVNPPQTKS